MVKVPYHYLQIGQTSFEGRVSEADRGLLSLVSPPRSLWRPIFLVKEVSSDEEGDVFEIFLSVTAQD